MQGKSIRCRYAPTGNGHLIRIGFACLTATPLRGLFFTGGLAADQ